MVEYLIYAFIYTRIHKTFHHAKAPPVAERFCARTGWRKVPGSILGGACRPSRTDFSVVFSKTGLNVGWDPLERPPLWTLPQRPRTLSLQPINQSSC